MPSRPRASGVQRSTFGWLRGLLVAIVLALAVLVTISFPSSPLTVAGADAALAGRTVAGAFHVHTTRSDGLGDKAAVAGAAHRAGLQFVVFTDHGDGTRTPDPPEYIDGVLCVDGVEISTNGGHYIAVGARQSPYPLGGESAAVAEDVARLGGFGVAAHPLSLRPELAWSDWSVPVDALEWVSADSEWRDESRWQLTRALVGYLFRPAGALAGLLDRPETALSRWDDLTRTRRVLAIAGHDAHGGIGRRIEDGSQGRRVRIPSYDATFRTFSTRAVLERPATGDAAVDAGALLDALRSGSFFTTIDAVATGPATLQFTARAGGETAGQGGALQSGGPATFSARAAVPRGATIVAFKNGVELARREGGALDFDATGPGAHRVEVQVAGAPGVPPVPWLVSNPIFSGLASQAPIPARTVGLPLAGLPWRIEKEQGSAGDVRVDEKSGEVAFDYHLRDGVRVSQFVAAVIDLPRNPPPFEAVSFVARANGPSRVSVQLRFAGDAHARWVKSVYVDSSPTPLTASVADFRRADGPPTRPDAIRATSLLFVVDLTNARPGDRGSIRLSDLALAR
jgi:hypothetical protein